jgi:hypothetical protein
MNKFYVLVLIIASLLTTTGRAGELASSFKQAAALGDAQEKDPATWVYQRRDLTPYYEQKYRPVFQSCLKSTNHPDTSSFSFVVVIGKDGRVMRLYIDHDTTVYTCVRQTLQEDEFPRPPVSPYYWHVEMSFAK